MSKAPDPIPPFSTEDEEREFWATADSTDHVDWSRARRMKLPRLATHATKSHLQPHTPMRDHYDFEGGKPNPHASPRHKTVRLEMELRTLVRYQALAERRGMPLESLLLWCLREAVEELEAETGN